MMSGRMRKKNLKLKKSEKSIEKLMVTISPPHLKKTAARLDQSTIIVGEDVTHTLGVSDSKRPVEATHTNGSVCDVMDSGEHDSEWEDVSESLCGNNRILSTPVSGIKTYYHKASKLPNNTLKLRRTPSPFSKVKPRRSYRHRKKVSPIEDTTYHNSSPRHVQTTLKDHFTVRRSTRKCKSVLKDEMHDTMVRKLLNREEDGMKVVEVEGKGRGIVATKHFSKGEFICEYSGELTTDETARGREADYQKNCLIGCYMYYFFHNGKKYCIDATKDNGRYGRLINHSRTSPNIVTKVFAIGSHPYLCLMAGRDIEPGEELQYDYGDRRKSAMEAHPWLRY